MDHAESHSPERDPSQRKYWLHTKNHTAADLLSGFARPSGAAVRREANDGKLSLKR